MSETATKKTFQDYHEEIDPDPVIELRRRLQMWASCPAADGGALTPSSAIVPDQTIKAILAQVSRLQAQVAELEKRNGELVERASAIFDKRKGAYGTCLIDRSKGELSRDLEQLRALLDGASK